MKGGYHEYSLNYIEKGGGQFLTLSYEGPGITKKEVPNDVFFYTAPVIDTIVHDTSQNVVTGVNYAYFEGTFNALPDFTKLTAVKKGIDRNISLSPRTQDDNFAFQFTGYLSVPVNGLYTFYTSSDDGSNLFINDAKIVDNDGLHGMQERSGTVQLTAGLHKYEINFFEKAGGEQLVVNYEGPGIPKQPFPDQILFTIISPKDTVITDTTQVSENGINYAYYEGYWTILPDFSALPAIITGTVLNFDLTPAVNNDNFGFQFVGYIDLPTNGTYTFYTDSDDGSKLYIDNIMVVDNDGLHGSFEQAGSLYLTAGRHAITVGYFDRTLDHKLLVSYEGPGIAKQLVPSKILFKSNSAWARQATDDGTESTSMHYAPNPTQGLVNIEFQSVESGELTVQLINSMSSISFEKKLNVIKGLNQISLNFEELASGIYLLSCIKNDIKLSGKIVIVK